MSAVINTNTYAGEPLPLVTGNAGRTFAWRHGAPVTLARFVAQVRAVAARLPPGACAVNLCDDRYNFLVAFCAVACAGQTNLLPPSRAPQAVADVMQAHAGSYAIVDRAPDPASPCTWRLPDLDALTLDELPYQAPHLPGEHIVAIGYTSGSTGVPKANPKTWASFSASTALNANLLRDRCGTEPLNLVATVPSQHMYGMETSVLLPLLADVAIHDARPLLPADVARALAAVPSPRVLVATPVHLRALVQAGVTLPPLAAVLSATAPLAPDLAAAAEACFDAPVIEVFGSTETCVIAHRRTARDEDWQAYAGVELKPQPDGTQVDAPWFDTPVLLQDVMELLPQHRFRLRGRNADLLEVAGKRASLGDLTRRLLAIPGVEDAVVFQNDDADTAVHRIAALAVAPTLSEAQILAALRTAVDPAFLPRPLRVVAKLPRNETGKLPRAALLGVLRGG